MCALSNNNWVWYGMVEVCEGAPVAVSGWVLADRHDVRPCAATVYRHIMYDTELRILYKKMQQNLIESIWGEVVIRALDHGAEECSCAIPVGSNVSRTKPKTQNSKQTVAAHRDSHSTSPQWRKSKAKKVSCFFAWMFYLLRHRLRESRRRRRILQRPSVPRTVRPAKARTRRGRGHTGRKRWVSAGLLRLVKVYQGLATTTLSCIIYLSGWRNV